MDSGDESVKFSGYIRFLMERQWTSHYAMFWLYLTIVVLSITVCKLGFAKRLPVFKSVIIYALPVIGCLILTVLALQLPIVGVLFIAAIVLSIYKTRLKSTQKKTIDK